MPSPIAICQRQLAACQAQVTSLTAEVASLKQQLEAAHTVTLDCGAVPVGTSHTHVIDVLSAQT